jgi:ABC-type sugar transport system ATPase subunit
MTSVTEASADGDGRVPVLEVRELGKSFGAVRALENVSLKLYAGEVLGLVGDNGAGKSTLVKCIAGIHRPDAGEIHIDGELRDHLTPDSARDLGIETVHQNLSLVDTLDVSQNFFLNRELTYRVPMARALGWLNKSAMYRETRKTLASLELNVNARHPVAVLSGGQRQMVAVARAITWGRHIVMLDEPAAALGVRQAIQVLDFVRMLAERGIAVLFISHNMQHVLQATDRIVVLRHGEKVGDLRTRETSARELVTLITGSDLVVSGQEEAV